MRLHRSRDPVTDEPPALPGETLILQGANLASDVQVLVGGLPAETVPLDDVTAQFTLPATAAGSFLEIAVLDGNAATLPVDAAAGDELTAAEVQTLVTHATLAADGVGLAVAVVDRAGRVLAIFRRPAASDATVEKALSLARTGAFF